MKNLGADIGKILHSGTLAITALCLVFIAGVSANVSADITFTATPPASSSYHDSSSFCWTVTDSNPNAVVDLYVEADNNDGNYVNVSGDQTGIGDGTDPVIVSAGACAPSDPVSLTPGVHNLYAVAYETQDRAGTSVTDPPNQAQYRYVIGTPAAPTVTGGPNNNGTPSTSYTQGSQAGAFTVTASAGTDLHVWWAQFPEASNDCSQPGWGPSITSPYNFSGTDFVKSGNQGTWYMNTCVLFTGSQTPANSSVQLKFLLDNTSPTLNPFSFSQTAYSTQNPPTLSNISGTDFLSGVSAIYGSWTTSQSISCSQSVVGSQGWWSLGTPSNNSISNPTLNAVPQSFSGQSNIVLAACAVDGAGNWSPAAYSPAISFNLPLNAPSAVTASVVPTPGGPNNNLFSANLAWLTGTDAGHINPVATTEYAVNFCTALNGQINISGPTCLCTGSYNGNGTYTNSCPVAGEASATLLPVTITATFDSFSNRDSIVSGFNLAPNTQYGGLVTTFDPNAANGFGFEGVFPNIPTSPLFWTPPLAPGALLPNGATATTITVTPPTGLDTNSQYCLEAMPSSQSAPGNVSLAQYHTPLPCPSGSNPPTTLNGLSGGTAYSLYLCAQPATNSPLQQACSPVLPATTSFGAPTVTFSGNATQNTFTLTVSPANGDGTPTCALLNMNPDVGSIQSNIGCLFSNGQCTVSNLPYANGKYIVSNVRLGTDNTTACPSAITSNSGASVGTVTAYTAASVPGLPPVPTMASQVDENDITVNCPSLTSAAQPAPNDPNSKLYVQVAQVTANGNSGFPGQTVTSGSSVLCSGASVKIPNLKTGTPYVLQTYLQSQYSAANNGNFQNFDNLAGPTTTVYTRFATPSIATDNDSTLASATSFGVQIGNIGNATAVRVFSNGSATSISDVDLTDATQCTKIANGSYKCSVDASGTGAATYSNTPYDLLQAEAMADDSGLYDYSDSQKSTQQTSNPSWTEAAAPQQAPTIGKPMPTSNTFSVAATCPSNANSTNDSSTRYVLQMALVTASGANWPGAPSTTATSNNIPCGTGPQTFTNLQSGSSYLFRIYAIDGINLTNDQPPAYTPIDSAYDAQSGTTALSTPFAPPTSLQAITNVTDPNISASGFALNIGMNGLNASPPAIQVTFTDAAGNPYPSQCQMATVTTGIVEFPITGVPSNTAFKNFQAVFGAQCSPGIEASTAYPTVVDPTDIAYTMPNAPSAPTKISETSNSIMGTFTFPSNPAGTMYTLQALNVLSDGTPDRSTPAGESVSFPQGTGTATATVPNLQVGSPYFLIARVISVADGPLNSKAFDVFSDTSSLYATDIGPGVVIPPASSTTLTAQWTLTLGALTNVENVRITATDKSGQPSTSGGWQILPVASIAAGTPFQLTATQLTSNDQYTLTLQHQSTVDQSWTDYSGSSVSYTAAPPAITFADQPGVLTSNFVNGTGGTINLSLTINPGNNEAGTPYAIEVTFPDGSIGYLQGDGTTQSSLASAVYNTKSAWETASVNVLDNVGLDKTYSVRIGAKQIGPGYTPNPQWSNPVSIVTPHLPPQGNAPNAVSNLTAYHISATRIFWSWTAPTTNPPTQLLLMTPNPADPTGNTDTQIADITTTNNVTPNTWNDKNLALNTPYNRYIKCVSATGTSYSNLASATTLAQAGTFTLDPAVFTSGAFIDNVGYGVNITSSVFALFSSALDPTTVLSSNITLQQCTATSGAPSCGPSIRLANIFTTNIPSDEIALQPATGTFGANQLYKVTFSSSILDEDGDALSAGPALFYTAPVASVQNCMPNIDANGLSTTFCVPANTFPQGGFVVVRNNFGPTTNALTLPGLAPAQAVNASPGIVASPTIRELIIFSAPGVLQSNFSANVTIQYPPLSNASAQAFAKAAETGQPFSQSTGLTLSPAIDPATLSVYTIDPKTKRPMPVGGSTLDSAANMASAPVGANGIFFVAAQLQTSLSSAYAYPVPFKPSIGHTTIKFDNLAVGSTIKVYTIMGELVWQGQNDDSAVGPGNPLHWNVTNTAGEPVASGVYIYQIKNGFNEKRGKLIIIR